MGGGTDHPRNDPWRKPVRTRAVAWTQSRTLERPTDTTVGSRDNSEFSVDTAVGSTGQLGVLCRYNGRFEGQLGVLRRYNGWFDRTARDQPSGPLLAALERHSFHEVLHMLNHPGRARRRKLALHADAVRDRLVERRRSLRPPLGPGPRAETMSVAAK